MQLIEEVLRTWKSSLCKQVDLAALHSRNPIAHKWKAPFRSLVLRETVFWRTHDSLSQSKTLHDARHALGARILLRSALETLATLIYLNQETASVVDGKLDYSSFSNKTSNLLLGSRDESTEHSSINILSVFDKCDRKYPGMLAMYSNLSESAHPNFSGMCFGYSRVDHEYDVSNFSNNKCAMYDREFNPSLELCIEIFQYEYDIEWNQQFERLETWLVDNDSMLESNLA